MSLKRRDLIAYLLILASALAWTAGQKILNRIPGVEDDAAVTTTFSTTRRGEDFSEVSYERLSTAFSEDSTEDFSEAAADIFSTEIFSESEEHILEESLAPPPALWGFLLRAFGIAAAFVSVFLLFQKAPFTGPDGAGVLLTLAGVLRLNGASAGGRLAVALYFLTILLLLYVLRELWGWLWHRCPISWCALCRFMINSRRTWLSFLLLFIWNLAAFLLLFDLIRQYPFTGAPLILAGLLIMILSGMGCLYKYAADLRHFQKQLEQFQNGLPVTVKEHSLIHAERQLSAVQSRHEEAIQTAVTSERFKVELISNVSHDLRTPLTSILGYGELLEKENLSPTGEEQLRRLNQKAGYMLDLVESLFELTKVSSGAAECKKEEIDLIRLLEQTIGLFDDQLTAAGLGVRRQYKTPSLPVTTDGSRLHQVFANLLGNAIKYALSGTRIYLEVKQTETECSVRMVNTASYEMDFQPEEILQRFARGDKARSTQGSGLGLAIAQIYTESVGGQFQVVIDGDQFHAIVRLPL